MGDPLNAEKGFLFLDLDDFLAYRLGKFRPAPRLGSPAPQPSFSVFLIRFRPTTTHIFSGSRFFRQQRNRDPFFQPQLHTTKLELQSIPLPIPTLFPLTSFLSLFNIFHGFTP